MLSHRYECYVNRDKNGKEYVHQSKEAAEYAASFDPSDYIIIADCRSGEVRFCDLCLQKPKKLYSHVIGKIGDVEVCRDCQREHEKAQNPNSA